MNNDCVITIESLDQTIETSYADNYVPIGLFCSDAYAPPCGILIESIIEHSNGSINYDILVLESEISKENKQKMLSL